MKFSTALNLWNPQECHNFAHFIARVSVRLEASRFNTARVARLTDVAASLTELATPSSTPFTDAPSTTIRPISSRYTLISQLELPY